MVWRYRRRPLERSRQKWRRCLLRQVCKSWSLASMVPKRRLAKNRLQSSELTSLTEYRKALLSLATVTGDVQIFYTLHSLLSDLLPFVQLMHYTCFCMKCYCIAVERVREDFRQIGITSRRGAVNLEQILSSNCSYSTVKQKSRATAFLLNIECPVTLVPLCIKQFSKLALSPTVYTHDTVASVARICVGYTVLDRSCFRGYVTTIEEQTGGAALCGVVVSPVNVISSL